MTDKFLNLETENRMLRERLGPRGLEVVMIDGRGHYVNEAVKAEIERLRADIPADVVVLRSDRENLAKRVAELVNAIREAGDLLAERTHGNGARSPGHNARLRLESVLAHTEFTIEGD